MLFVFHTHCIAVSPLQVWESVYGTHTVLLFTQQLILFFFNYYLFICLMECDSADCSVCCRISNAEACQTYSSASCGLCPQQSRCPDRVQAKQLLLWKKKRKGPKTLQQGAVGSRKGGDSCASVRLNLPPGDESEAVRELRMKRVSGSCPNCTTPATSAWGIFSLFLHRSLKQPRRGLWTPPAYNRAELSSTWGTRLVVG